MAAIVNQACSGQRIKGTHDAFNNQSLEKLMDDMTRKLKSRNDKEEKATTRSLNALF